MKKVFKLHIDGKNSDRVLDAIKHEVRKYVKRERRKMLPPGVDYWAFDCKFGVAAEIAEATRLPELNKKMDEVASAGGDSFYVEIIARHGIRTPHEEQEKNTGDEEDDLEE